VKRVLTLCVALAVCQVLICVLDQVQQGIKGCFAVQIVQQSLMHFLLGLLDVLC